MKRRNLLRKESFGGTLLLSSGRREYLTASEFTATAKSNCLPLALISEFEHAVPETRVTEPQFLPTSNFSAPDRVFLEVTRVCNLTCSHCFNSSGRALPDQLDQAKFRMVLEDLAAAGVQEIRLTGGEPTAHVGLVEMVSLASNLGIHVSIGTNATLIDRRLGRALASAGLRSAVVSLDGLEEVHDHIRGHGSFLATMLGLEILRDNDVSIRVNSVLMKSTVDSVFALVELLASRDIPTMIRRFIPSGRAAGDWAETLTAEDYSRIRDRLRPQLDNPKRLVDGHYLRLSHRTTRIPIPFAVKDCSAGHRGMVILPTGQVQTCGFLAPLGELSIGRVPHEPFSLIWARLVSSSHIEQLESNLSLHNSRTNGLKTNCLAIALAAKEGQALLQIQDRKARR